MKPNRVSLLCLYRLSEGKIESRSSNDRYRYVQFCTFDLAYIQLPVPTVHEDPANTHRSKDYRTVPTISDPGFAFHTVPLLYCIALVCARLNDQAQGDATATKRKPSATTTMDGDAASLEDLIQQAKKKGVWVGSHQALRDKGLDSILRELLTDKLRLDSILREVIAQKQEVIAQKQEVIAQKQEVINRRSLRQLKDWKWRLVNLTASDPHVKELKHRKAQVVRVDYDIAGEIAVPWDEAFTPPENSVDSEIDVQFFVVAILRSIANSVSTEIHFAMNRRIAGIECDILLMHGNNRIPFSAVEIKKNGVEKFVRAIFNDDESVEAQFKGKVQGEHLLQLEQIQLFGFEKVFGVISDGNHSMITCTASFTNQDDPPSSGQEKTLSKKQDADVMQEEGSRTSPDNEVKFVGKQPQLKKTIGRIMSLTPPPSLYCSNYSSVVADSEEVNWEPTLKLLTRFVNLAFNSVNARKFHREIPLNTPLSARIIRLREPCDLFAHQKITFTGKPSLRECLLEKKNVAEILLFKHLGMGRNGDCCLATTRDLKSFCAVKFFADRAAAQENAQSECDLWNSIYDGLPRARTVKLPRLGGKGESANPDYCLCMPYLVPIDGDKRTEALGNGSIDACLNSFRTKNYLHNEVLWRHLGFFGKSTEEQKVYLCDLGSLTQRSEETDAEWERKAKEWKDTCKDQLHQTAGLSETSMENDKGPANSRKITIF